MPRKKTTIRKEKRKYSLPISKAERNLVLQIRQIFQAATAHVTSGRTDTFYGLLGSSQIAGKPVQASVRIAIDPVSWLVPAEEAKETTESALPE